MLTRGQFITALASTILIPIGSFGCSSNPKNTARLKGHADLQVAVDRARASAKTPGFAVAAIKGRETYAAVSGFRTMNEKYPVTLADRWHIGSVTKMMTAHLVATFVEQREFSWDSTIGELFGKIEPNMDPQYRDATLVHFLTHRSGMQLSSNDFSARMSEMTRKYIEQFGVAGPPPAGFDVGDFAGDPRVDRLHWTRAALQEPPVAPTGQDKRIYENGNYVVVASILEQLADRDYEQLMRERVFTPLRMSNAGFGPPGTDRSSEIAPTDPYGHRRHDGRVTMLPPSGPPRPDNPPVLSPSGRVHTSLSDIAQFMRDHVSGHRREAAHLSAESYNVMHNPPFGDDYAMGWITRERGGIGHGGTNGAWLAILEIRPAENVGVFVATNLGPPDETAPAANTLIAESFDFLTG